LDNQGRFILFIVLSMMIVVGTTFMAPRPQQPPPTSQPSVASSPHFSDAATTSQAPPKPVKKPTTVKAPAVKRTTSVPVTELTIETDDYIATFSNQGGVLTVFQLKKYLNRQTFKPSQLVNPDPTQPKPFSLSYSPIPDINQQMYEVKGSSKRLSKSQEQAEIIFRYVDGNGTILEKTFGFTNGKYLIDFDIKVRQTGKGSVPSSLLSVEWPNNLGKEEMTGTSSFAKKNRVATLSGTGGLDSQKPKKSQDITEIPAPVLWTALADQFFVAALIPDPASGGASAKVVRDFNAYKPPTPEDLNPGIDPKMFGPRPMLLFTGQALQSGESFQRKGRVYFGPQEFTVLKSQNVQLEKIVDFGMFGFISVYMLMLLKWFFTWCGNWGLAIILLSILVKLVLWLPTHSSYKNMYQTQQKMKDMKPKMDAIKRKYADLRQKKADLSKYPGENQELTALYQQGGLNPMGGCLPMLLQLPVFYALYGTLNCSIELRSAPFLWLNDMTLRDPFYVLPLLMGGSMMLQQKISGQMSTQISGQQKFMMWFFPVFLTFISFQWPAGLLLYWVVTNVLSILQQKVVNREIQKAKKKDEVVKS
jgi:YidC/Oxa1 family membrane protein insertase